MAERRKTDIELIQRLVKVETSNKQQSDALSELAADIKEISKFVHQYAPMVDSLVQCDLPTRVARIETRNKIYTGILLFVAGLATFKEHISKWLFGG